ncbi:MAG: hypothetical protein VYA67_03530 [Actinomycetota bacterium]|nr:hypothetical protein [Actinomycetota bacterium]
MGADQLKVPSDQLVRGANQWQALSAGLTVTPPSPGQQFQPTAAAISAIDAAIAAATAACAARIQDTAARVISAAAGYANEDATGQAQIAGVAPSVQIA